MGKSKGYEQAASGAAVYNAFSPLLYHKCCNSSYFWRIDFVKFFTYYQGSKKLVTVNVTGGTT